VAEMLALLETLVRNQEDHHLAFKKVHLLLKNL
jgi:hypothetical protein